MGASPSDPRIGPPPQIVWFSPVRSVDLWFWPDFSARLLCRGKNDRMSENLRNYTKAVYAMDAVVQRAPSESWNNPSPCSEWTAREVLGHCIWHAKRIANAANGGDPPAEQAEADVAGPDPTQSWAEARDGVLAALDQPGVLAQVSSGPFGEQSLDSALALSAADLTTHAWDIAKATDQPAIIPEDLAQSAYEGMKAAGDMLRRPGLLDAEVDVPNDADIVSKFVAMAGRQP